ncbi:hypothetical protein Tco_0419801, partial [Tanacetum coccineum]
LKDLSFHMEYAYLEENDKLPVNIAKGLKGDEKDALLKVLKSHKRAIAWKIIDIKCNTLKSEHAAECLNIQGRYIFGSIAQDLRMTTKRVI